MSKQRDEKWLDEELRRIVNGATPEFDVQAWKQKHPAEFQSILSGGTTGKASGCGMVRAVLAHPWAKLAAAAAVIIVAGGLFFGLVQHQPQAPVDDVQPVVQSPTQIVTMMSLRGAYRRGGTEALERQLDEALRVLGPRPATISMHVLFDNSEG